MLFRSALAVFALACPFLFVMKAKAEVVTWYAYGTHTANGERFNPDGMTCAHLTFPFGTMLRVTYRARSIVCRVNDRGPAKWTGAHLDLARGAARRLGIIHAGKVRARVERLR